MGRMSPLEQGDFGEQSAIDWLRWHGYAVYLPLGHSPHCDLIAEDGPKLLRVQVKTLTVFFKNRWAVAVCTKGGNQSWSAKYAAFEVESDRPLGATAAA